MTLTAAKLKDIVFYLALFSLIPLWNIPHTIAARYVCEGLLLVLILSSSLDWKPILSKAKLVILFFTYLFIQLFFFSTDLKSGLSGFKSEWMHFILFSLTGAGAGLIISKQKSEKTLLYIGAAFTLPLFIHLCLSAIKGFEIGAVPWRYWGINEIHGDLGYTALQAAVLLSTYFLIVAKTRSQKILSCILMLSCIVSPLIAQSRGGVLFALAAILFTFTAYFLIVQKKSKFSIKGLLILISVIICVGFIVKMGISVDPARWTGAFSRASVGFQGDPNALYCNGIDSLRNSLKANGVAITPQIEAGIKSVEDGDGARVMAARSGLRMALENLMGINGSKQAYQIAITRFCGKPPAIFISHTHNAWLDTALAIGIPGAILLLLVMLNYGWQGFRMIKQHNQINPFALALFVSAGIWILRGVLDSTLRDQMLEMQAFILAFLLAAAINYQAKISGAK
jgi:O-antigen ligase